MSVLCVVKKPYTAKYFEIIEHDQYTHMVVLGITLLNNCIILYIKVYVYCTVATKSLYVQVKIYKYFLRKIVNIFLPINFDICFGCSKEPPH